MGNLSVGLAPDFGTSRFIVGLLIGRGIILVEVAVLVGLLLVQVLGLSNYLIAAKGGWSLPQFGPEASEQQFAGRRDILGHDQGKTDAQTTGQSSVGNAGVAAGGVEQAHACLPATALEGFAQQVKSRAHFDTTTKLLPFQLSVELDSRLGKNFLQGKKRRLPNIGTHDLELGEQRGGKGC